MTNKFTLRMGLVGTFLALIVCCQSSLFAQVSLTSTGGTPTGTFTTLSDAFVAINAGTHTGTIAISINGNTTEPAAPVYLVASGEGAASYTGIGIKPTVVATISGATTPGSAVINLDGADNVTIDGSITLGGTTRDLTIQNTALNTVANVACIRLVGRTTLGLGATNITISNCNITGSTTGNNGSSGSTVTSTYGIYAGSSTLTTMGATTGGADYDNITINNNFITNAYIGINIIGVAANQADNLIVQDNTIGSLVNRIGFKGFAGQHLVGGNFTNNTVTSIESTASVSVAGVDVGGSATAGFQVRRNTVTDIRSFAPSGYGAYGINVATGSGVVISNNAISGVQTLRYSNSTTFNAFGIRLAGGTGHQVYYNSVNMYGDYSIGNNLANSFSAAFVVTSTGITGIDVRNNVFANKMTSNATTNIEFLAMSFPTSYNFLNATIERNAYFVTNDAQHHVGKIGTTVGTAQYTTLNDWRTISQVNNPTNDVNSHPGSGNSNAPFTSDSDLGIPATTITVMESTGLPIASLGLPNVDRNNVNRPMGTGTNPDLGAYEFEGSTPGDLVPPVVSGVAAAPGTSCTNIAHVVTATASDNVGVTSVTLSYSYDGVAQTPITMVLASGTALNGTYTGTIPAAVGQNVNVTYSVLALDAGANSSGSISGAAYADNYLIVTASADQAINTGVATTISATTNDPSFGSLLISEVVQFKTGTGATSPYPAYAVGADLVELSNIADVAVNVSGYNFEVMGVGARTYTFPANVFIPAGGVLVLHLGTGTDDPSNLYYNSGGANDAISSTSVSGYILSNGSNIVDVVATNGFSSWGSSGVTAGDWSGNIASSSGLAGVRRTVATDNNNATDWTLSSITNVMTIGVYNSEITIVPIPQTITWTNNFNATSSTLNPLAIAPFATPGVYTYTATFNDGTCTSTDEVVITVTTPVAPVASFSATPITGSAPLNVAFTDLSTNIPDAWTWTVSPMIGVTYLSGTSATSQNPIMQFSNSGMYTITLTASNVAGSDDSTIVQYINVDWCASAADFTGDTDLGNVTFGGINNGVATPVFSNPGATGTYTDFTALTPEVFGVGQSYPISVSQITSGGTFYAAHANVFIDYNNDGSFDPVSERVFDGATTSGGTISTVSGTVTIPLTATIGVVRMRVILQEGGNATSPACGSYGYGETEDYLIEIKCSSVAPIAGSDVICSGETSTLTATANNVQWYADATTTTVLSTGASYTTPALTSTTSYFATGSDIGCVESARTEFVVTVNQPTTATQTVSSCVDYVWPIDGNTYAATGMYTATIPNAAGCDSVITLDLTILGATSGTDVQTACDSYTWIDGVTYTASNNTATFMLQTAAGCDSLVSLDLTISNSTSATQVVSTCEAYVWQVDGNTYSATGMYTAIIPNAAGCDSTITLDFTLNTATTSTTTVSTCGDYVWSADGMTYTTAGTYTATLVNAAGCDSIATLVLTISSVSELGVTVTNGTLTADLVPAPNVTYGWLDCGNNFAAIVGASGQSYTPTVNGSYAVRIIENGCVDTSACFTINNVGLDFNKLADLSIVPNPTNNLVTISFEGSDAHLTVLDLNGKAVAELEVSSGDTVDMTAFENGVYLFTIYNESFKAIERVVKQ